MLVIQIILLFLVGLFPQSMNVPANAMMSFSCAMQVNAFRKFHGIPCATTMCIGNMRSATEMLCKYQVTGNQELKKKYALLLCNSGFCGWSGHGSIIQPADW